MFYFSWPFNYSELANFYDLLKKPFVLTSKTLCWMRARLATPRGILAVHSVKLEASPGADLFDSKPKDSTLDSTRQDLDHECWKIPFPSKLS
jgi:hypothetical protein